MIQIIVMILVIALICGAAIYILDRMPFIGQPFNAILKVIIIVVGIILVLEELGLFSGFGSLGGGSGVSMGHHLSR